MMRSVSDNTLAILLLGLAILLSGCENNFDPLNREKGNYSVHGALNVYADTNYIRVRNLNTPFASDSTRELNVTVTLTDVDRSATETLQDSVVQYDDIYTHNFRALMDIRPETQYRVTVDPRQGNDSIQATTTTPQITAVSAQPTGMDCETEIQLTFEPVQSPSDINAMVGFRHQGRLEQTEVGVGSGDAPNQASVTFTPLDVLNTPAPCTEPEPSTPPPTWCHQLDVDKLFIQYTHFGPQSTESTVNDSVRIPGGIGSFRSYYRDVHTVPIDTTNLCGSNCGCDGWTPRF